MVVHWKPPGSGISGLVLCSYGGRGTHHARVPEQADGSPMDGGYEVSEKHSRPTDLQRIW